MDLADGLKGVRSLSGGLVDTSTLIYLDHSALLRLVAEVFAVHTLPQVVQEFGTALPGTIQLLDAPAGPADTVVLDMALVHGLPLLSEDGRLLRATARLGHPHYNSLMLLLALLARGELSTRSYYRHLDRLLNRARYSEAVIAFGNRIFLALKPGIR